MRRQIIPMRYLTHGNNTLANTNEYEIDKYGFENTGFEDAPNECETKQVINKGGSHLKTRLPNTVYKSGKNLVHHEVNEIYSVAQRQSDGNPNDYATDIVINKARSITSKVPPFLRARNRSGLNLKKRQKLLRVIRNIIASLVKLGGILLSSGAGLLVIICLLGMLLSSSFGILFASEDTGGEKLKDVIRTINMDFYSEIDSKADEIQSDDYEVRGTRASWKDILSIYAVLETSGDEQINNVLLFDDFKINKVERVFNFMNDVSYSSETRQGEKEDEEETILIVTVTHKTLDEAATKLGFDDEQKELLNELQIEGFDQAWNRLLYGIYDSTDIVEVALSQLGNIGGEPYWSWYGYTERVPWCACFVSWCGEQCGILQKDLIPKFSGVIYGVNWFKEKGQFLPGTEEPIPGQVIFFDWDDPKTNGQDEVPDHVGIVERVEDGTVYTIEGNSGDSCRINAYPIGHYEIFGYGLINNT